MKKVCIALAASLVCAACGEKANEAKEAEPATDAMAPMATSGDKMAESANEAQQVMAERKAKGDTIALPYKDLQAYLPTISGYSADGGPSGQGMNMGVFSMSNAEQKYVSGSGADAKHMKVTITDYSGSEAGYGMMAPLAAMNISSEDDRRRSGTVRIGVPTSFAIEEFNKDDKSAKITAGTRYRYFIVIEATNQKEDVTKDLIAIAEDVAKKFAGK